MRTASTRPADGGYPTDADLHRMSDDGGPVGPDPARWVDPVWRDDQSASAVLVRYASGEIDRRRLGDGYGHLDPVGVVAEPAGGVRLADGQTAGVVCDTSRDVDEALDRVAHSWTDDGWMADPFPPEATP